MRQHESEIMQHKNNQRILAVTFVFACIAAAIWNGPGKDIWNPIAKPQAIGATTPKTPSPLDVGKGIEAKLDQLLDAFKSLTLDALKAAYFQGVFHGILATSVLFAILIAFTRRGAS
jgi:hypothetical protein